MKVKVSNEKVLGTDIIKFIKDRNALKIKDFSLDYAPILKKIEKELRKEELKRFKEIKLLLIPAKHSYVDTDCYFTFKIEYYNQSAGTITLKYIN